MKQKPCIALVLLGAGLAGGVAAAPVVVTFDDLVFDHELVDGYGGISGWQRSVRTYDPLPALGQMLQARSATQSFDLAPVRLDGMDFVSWTVEGQGGFRLFHQGAQVYEYRDLTGNADPAWLNVAWTGPVDQIEFFGSSDGFLLDNLTYTVLTPVPEAQITTLLLAGLGLTGWRVRQRR